MYAFYTTHAKGVDRIPPWVYTDLMKQEAKEQLVNRLKRIEGQIKAVQRMLDEGVAEPKQVMMQLSAVISSLENAKIAMVEEYTREKILSSLDTLSELLK